MDSNEQPIGKINLDISTKLGMIICGTGIVLLGLLSWVYDYITALTK